MRLLVFVALLSLVSAAASAQINVPAPPDVAEQTVVAPTGPAVQGPVVGGGASVAQTTSSAPEFASGGPYDPDLQHAVQGIGGPNDPDASHRQARERDERRYLAQFGKPWQYAVYVTSAA